MNTNANPFKLEVGKRYIRRDGAISGPVVYCGGTDHTFTCAGHYYTASGGFHRSGVSILDLIAEYIEPRTVDRTVFGAAQVGAEPVPVNAFSGFRVTNVKPDVTVKPEWHVLLDKARKILGELPVEVDSLKLYGAITDYLEKDKP